MAARFADDEQSAGTADRLGARLADLADADVAAYEAYVAARRGDGSDVRAALDRAVDVPLEVATLARDVAGLAERLTRTGNPRLRGDASTAYELAAAAVRSAARLVAENLPGRTDDDRVEQARVLARAVPPMAG